MTGTPATQRQLSYIRSLIGEDGSGLTKTEASCYITELQQMDSEERLRKRRYGNRVPWCEIREEVTGLLSRSGLRGPHGPEAGSPQGAALSGFVCGGR